MTIAWDKVTRLSQLVAIVLFVGVFALGFWLGTAYEKKAAGAPAAPGAHAPAETGVIGDATYQCAGEHSMHAVFYDDKVTVMLSDGRTLNLAHTISGSGTRYATEDDSIVFWEKGPTAFLTEGDTTTYADCAEAPIPN